MPSFDHDGIRFQYRDEGQGLPFVFQHGLGGDLNQPFGVYRPAPGVRLLGFDFRAHGQTRPLGDPDKLRIATLADDCIRFIEHLGIDRAVIGGISLGSAVAVKIALHYPDRVLGLVLSRPAWIGGPQAGQCSPLRDHRSTDPREGRQGRFASLPRDARVSGDGPRIARLCTLAHRPVRAAEGRGMRGQAGAIIQRLTLRSVGVLRRYRLPC